MSLRDDISKIPKLKNMGLALVDYVESLRPQIQFELKNRRWVPTENFVTFTVQFAQSQNIVISLRGNINEFIEFEELPLREGMGYGAYSECTLERPNQLPAIAMHIRRAYEIYQMGRTRNKKSISIIEG